MKQKIYELEELLPVVTKLTEKYCAGESTSVTYEKASQIMQAVLYCIHELEASKSDKKLISQETLPAMEAYELGYQKLIEKTVRIKEKYEQLMLGFDAYGNRNYKDTVEKGILGFLQHYDARWDPMNTILTMDYIPLRFTNEAEGADAIEIYLDAICLEQKFLRSFPREKVIQILQAYQKDYRDAYINICRVVYRYMLMSVLSGDAEASMDAKKEEWLMSLLKSMEPGELQEKFTVITRRVIEEYFNEDEALYEYLTCDLADYCVEIYNGLEYGNLHRVL